MLPLKGAKEIVSISISNKTQSTYRVKPHPHASCQVYVLEIEVIKGSVTTLKIL